MDKKALQLHFLPFIFIFAVKSIRGVLFEILVMEFECEMELLK